MKFKNFDLKRKLILITLIFLVSCGKSQISNNQVIKIDPIIEKHLVKDYQICHLSNECIDNQRLLKDLYGTGIKFIDANAVEVNGAGIANLIYSTKFIHKNDYYALFISGFGAYDRNGELPSCHACGQQMGLAIFKFNVDKNLWEGFSLNNNVGDFGSFGDLNLGTIKSSTLGLYGIANNNFLLTFEQGYMGQGYITQWIELISISKGDGALGSRRIGGVSIAEINCSGNKREELDWSSTREFVNNDKIPYPDVYLNIDYKSIACDEKNSKVIATKKRIYRYDVVKNSYLEVSQ